ncbi:MAG: tRNA-specific 2-thiouridylase [Parasphingorhabdus sp.]|jgi:tRNA-specific 2-thiouridylase
MPDQPKAVALISGGLDSMLAAKIIMQQGVHVEGINFYTGFCVEGHTHAIRNHDKKKPKRNNALWVAEQLGIKLHIIDIIDEYKDVVINPKHGYGAHMNPCLDCKCFMVGKAREWMEQKGFDFVITGEVLGQRPMSQRRQTFPIVERESGVGDRLLRPLCAQHMEPTLPELKGWVKREDLKDFTGRSRKPQIELAKGFGFTEWAQPAGGCCFLTDAKYSVKLKDLWSSRGTKQYDLDDIMLLKVGRHIRPQDHFKLIVARDEGEDRYLHGYRKRFDHLVPVSHAGPITLVEGEIDEEDRLLAAKITARYSQGRLAEEVELDFTPVGGDPSRMVVEPLNSSDLPTKWIL